ncbi:cytochrome P450 monooxygenase [Apodospora peruviana]|uniref:Cytochrome P450 monooxygenase n=1 Tax=Apodospora peruviana TaxID=516989 RepID=A0AAE0M590_9PEZI|nr:cytochrome P450 monooxygenase [Apodospora peruviana]
MSSSCQFLLAGDSQHTQLVSIPLSTASSFRSLHQLKQAVAAKFNVVDPSKLSFSVDGTVSEDLVSLLKSHRPIIVLVNGHAVVDPPGPSGLPFIGSHTEVYPDHIGNHERLFQVYGSLFQTTIMGRTVYHTNDPEITGHVFKESAFFTKEINSAHPLYGVKSPHAGVFLTSTHTDIWKEAHKFMVPSMGPKAIDKHCRTVVDIVRSTFPVFDELERTKQAFNVYDLMLKLSSQIVGKLFIDADFGHFRSADAPVHITVKTIFRLLGLNKKVTSWGDWYTYLPFGDPKRLRDTWHEVGERVAAHIAEAKVRREDGDVPLQEAALKTENLTDFFIRAVDNKGNKLPAETRKPALIVAVTAGFVTTSALLSWLLYGLTSYGDSQARILQELVDSGMTEDTDLSDGKFLSQLSFLDKYVKETQRHHTTSFQPARTARMDLVLPNGMRLPKGAVVIPEIHHLHHNREVWDNPQRFDPDRWDTEKVKNRDRSSYIPFAMGPRMCIASNFVLREVKIILAQLVFRYEFIRYRETEPIEYDPMFQTIRPRNLYMKTRKRTTWPSPSS